MLDPNYMLHISEPAEDIAEQLHNSIIKRIIDRIMLRIGRGEEYLLTATDKWQIETLQEAGILLEDIQAEIARKTRLQEQEIKEAMEEAGVKAIEYDDKIYESVGLSPEPLEQSPNLIRIMQRNYLATMGEWNNFTRTIAEASQQTFINACDIAYNHVITGSLSYTEAVKEAVNSIASTGVEVIYPSGHKDTIETATLRCVRTGVSQASSQIGLARMDEMGVDKVLISSHLGARPTHQVWQGKVFTKEQLYSTDKGMPAYGTVTGLCGTNCRHNISPYIEGMSNPFENFDSEENLKMYEREQRQRLLERRIRDTKREVLGLKEAMDKCQDEFTKSELERMYMRKSALLSKQNQAYTDYCEANGMKKLNDRISIAKWDRKQAAAARGAAQRWNKEHGGSVARKPLSLTELEKQFQDLTDGYSYDDFMNDFGTIEEGFEGASEREIKKAKEISKNIESIKKLNVKNNSLSKVIRTKKESIEILRLYGIDFIDKSSKPISAEVLSKYTDFIKDFEDTHSGYFGKNKVKLKSISVVDSVKGQKDYAGGIYRSGVNSIEIKSSSITSKPSKILSKSDDYELHPLAHEYGHYISDTLEKNLGITEADIVQSAINKYFDGDIFKSTKDLKDILSSYGSTSYTEAFAEAFAEAYTCKEPRKFSQIFKKELEEALKK